MIGYTLVIVDKSAAHPTAASFMECGIGDPYHATGEMDGKWPGIYRVSWSSGKSVFDGARFPKIIENGKEWVTQPILNYARTNGYEVKVHEAWVFEQHARLFTEWVRDLWQARVALRNPQLFPYEPGRQMAGDVIKGIMNSTISAMRVDWWAQMLGNSRAGILANLLKFAQDGYYPVFLYRDSIGYLTKSPMPLPFDNPDKLGGYKEVYRLYLTAEIVDQLKDICGSGEGAKFIKVLHQNARLAGVR